MELVGYRENLELLRTQFPDRVAISVQECAVTLGVNVKTVYETIRRQTNPLPVVYMGRKITIPVARLARWMCLK